ncbi:MAG TPA: 2-amino-4-hydroxy-6-hydroxymethyldihydropteridine diphosphokinase [Gemmatimonadetes bacterium]|nr:2-amino-4-hydroxy-6-hydroxymethyldihydropteridine diphosphokinase [Gemmatimonadota bacterium]
MARAYIGVGSNIDRERNVTASLDALSEAYGDLRLSTVLETDAVGFKGDPFYNLVVGLETTQPVGALAEFLRRVEDDCGRRRDTPKFSSRSLDLDLLTYGDVVGVVDGVSLPRPEITENAFVLYPLAEIAGDELHPVARESYADLWRQLDVGEQELRPVAFEWQRARSWNPHS